MFFTSITPLFNGNFGVAGDFRGNTDFRIDVYLQEADQNGDVVWGQAFSATPASVMPERLLVASDGRWIVAASDLDSSPENTGPVTAGYLADYNAGYAACARRATPVWPRRQQPFRGLCT